MTPRLQTSSFRPRLEALEDRCVPADFSASISGRAFVDRNLNRVLNAGEGFFSGAVVRLVGRSTTNVAVNTTVRANASGFYKFEHVMPGTYQVSGLATNGRQALAGFTVVIGPGQPVVRNMAYRPLTPLQVSLRQFTSTPVAGGPAAGTPGPGTKNINARENNKPITKGTLPDQTLAKNAGASFVDMAAYFDDVDMANSIVRFKTTAGDINVELFDRLAPQTVANFLNYVTSNQYDNTVFHRLAFNGSTPFVLQGGGFVYDEDARTITDPDPGNTRIPVNNEFNTSNTQGTISMAKLPAFNDANNNGVQDPGEANIPGGGPNSATDQFFFNLGNNAANLDNQNGGFTVFGRIVGATDQSVLNTLQGFTRSNQSTTNSAFDNFPVRNYTGTNFPTDAAENNLALVRDVEVVRRPEQLTYSIVSNNNSGVVTAEFVNNQLKLTPVANQTGAATITVKATDKFGATVNRTFTVEIDNGAPSVTDLDLTPATVFNDGELTATAAFSDPNSDPVTADYVWTVNDVVVRSTLGTTATTDVLDLDTITVAPGAIVKVTVTPKDSGNLTGTPVSQQITVGNRLPSVTVSLDTDSPTTNQILTATATTPVDADGDPVSLTYEWMVGSTVVRTFETTSLTDTLDLSVVGNGNKNDVITVTVTPNDGTGNGTAATDTATVIDTAPTIASVTISPESPTTGATSLTADVIDPLDADGDEITYTYVWTYNTGLFNSTSDSTSTSNVIDISGLTLSVLDVFEVTVTPRAGGVDGTPRTFQVTIS